MFTLTQTHTHTHINISPLRPALLHFQVAAPQLLEFPIPGAAPPKIVSVCLTRLLHRPGAAALSSWGWNPLLYRKNPLYSVGTPPVTQK